MRKNKRAARAKPGASLTPKQKRFIEEYLIDLNATKAALRTGYGKAGASVRGAELLATPQVRKAVDEAIAARSERTKITADRVLEELAIIAFSDPENYDEYGRVLEGLPPELSRAVGSVSEETLGSGGERTLIRRKLKLWDKPRGLTLAMRHLGMLNDKLTLNLDDEMRKLIGNAASDYDRRIAELAARAKKNASS